ncbi:hypothetical protein CU098_005870 [Rhizopus stolonifer]|uniref:Uncharacterized protein n=1 Tax=Rhizopus stolonifer TaxID=4846 RepID=A0A367KMM9_RHIST|nr:hypothetical protein CU098_005870 [Rhizopus stolonifer]
MEQGNPAVLRVNALRHGDKSLFTMLSAFVPTEQVQCCNYLTMTPTQLNKLPIHRMLIAREMGAKVMKRLDMPTSLSTFYRERVTISGHRNPVYSVVFDKTNRRLFTGSDDFLVKVWCVRTGCLIHTIRGHQNAIADIAINQENTLIATASTDGCVRVWTMDEYKPIMCLRPNANTASILDIKPFTTVKFSPSPRAETRYLMATNEDGFVRLWRWDRDTLQFFDIDTPITFSCRFRARDRLRCSSFNYTGTKFAVAGDDGFVYVFSTIPIQTTHEGTIISSNSHVDPSDNRPGRGRKRFANALFPDKNGPQNSQPVVTIGTLEGHMGSVTDLAYSHDGQRILSGSQDGTARIWKFDKDTKQWHSIVLDLKIPLPNTPIVRPSIPNSTAMKNDSSVTCMDMDPPSTIEHTDPPKVSMIAWSADDRWCIIASNQGDIRVYYAYNGEPACVLKGHEGEIYALDNHPLDPSTVLSAGYDGNVILWDIQKQKVITCTNHVGRTFTDCKFSKDAMKYAITDEEGHCTLFSIGGLDKDYEQVRSWERGQYFMSDYQALRHFVDGTFVDEPTQQMPYAMPYSPIIDLQGVAYPNQKKLGYGRNIPTTSETFELEDMKRSACYNQEEEEIRKIKVIVLPALDRATVARRRRDFVKNEDEDEDNLVANANTLFQFPPPVLPALLPDDSEDEDYHDDEQGNAAYVSSAASSDEAGSEDFVARDDEDVEPHSDEDGDEEGPVTRSRAGQLHTPLPLRSSRTINTTNRASSTSRRRGRGRGGRAGPGRGRVGRPARKRTRERSDDDEEEQPVRARARRRRVAERPSYVESDFESEQSEDELVDVLQVYEPQDDSFEAGPSTIATRQNNHQTHLSSESSSVYMPFTAIPSVGRFTRSRSHYAEAPSVPSTSKPSAPSIASKQYKRIGKQRDVPRELTKEEIKEHEPIPWITTTERSFTKYLPQVGDIVAILSEGHKQYLRVSEMKSLFDEKHGVIDKHEPVLFSKILQITWQVGPPAFCKLKLSMLQISNLQQVIQRQRDPIWAPLGREEYIEYTDEDGSPEFIILWQRFLASMDVFLSLKRGQKVDAMYDEGQYTGTISHFNTNGLEWKQVHLRSPWAYYHVIWDDMNLCPWELVPTGQDFRARYDVQPSLRPEQIQRARDVLDWLSNTEDFYLYVHQVNYYDYPAYLLENNFYRSLDGLIDDVELIKKNAMRYNADSSPAYKNAGRLANFFKTRIQKPSMPLSLSRGGATRKRIVKEDSDDEYDIEEAQTYESEDEPIPKKSSRDDRKGYHTDDDDDLDDFVNDSEEEEEDDYSD